MVDMSIENPNIDAGHMTGRQHLRAMLQVNFPILQKLFIRFIRHFWSLHDGHCCVAATKKSTTQQQRA